MILPVHRWHKGRREVRRRAEGPGFPTGHTYDVVGRPDADELFDLAERASGELRRDVSVRRVSPQAWASESDEPFLVSVRRRPLIRLALHRENDA